MKQTHILPETAALPDFSTSCEGGVCKNCGKLHLKVYGRKDADMHALHTNIGIALESFPVPYKLLSITEPNAIALDGVAQLPALGMDGILVSEGAVPTPAVLVEHLRNRYLYKSKLYRLRTLVVPVDVSAGAGHALRFAWHVAKAAGADIEVLYAMDSIFDGHSPSASGFLSGYQKTMQQELHEFIREALHPLGVRWEPAHASQPNEVVDRASAEQPNVRAKVVYGFPEKAIEDGSKEADLIVMGSSGRGALSKKLFGSVSTEVSRSAHCPVLFVPAEADFQGFGQIMYAGNFESLNALHISQTVSFARRFDSQIHFVHIGTAAEKDAAVEQKLSQANYVASHPDKPFIFSKVTGEEVVAGLEEYALYHGIELMVFVTHQRSFWEQILHQSITRAALLNERLPILIIHADDDMI